MHVNAARNEYQQILGALFDKAPKAVIAAIVVSLLIKEDPDYKDGHIRARFYGEWQTLFDNNIVPQRPPKKESYIGNEEVLHG